jgi:gamma-glutamyltranspeptidase/glutathione hydrolase
MNETAMAGSVGGSVVDEELYHDRLWRGTTSIEAADKDGWVISVTPSLALKEGRPYLCFSVQGGDTQDQNLLQFFLDMVEFGMTVQEATEAPNINSDQLWLSLGGERLEDRRPRPGHVLLGNVTPPYVRKELRQMGYTATYGDRTSGPINAIMIDSKHGTLWGGSSNNGEDYGIGW